MAQLHRLGELDVSEDLAFTRREWLLRRVVWALVLVTLLAALCGLLGIGPLSQVSAADGQLTSFSSTPSS